jgi:hypothetical protein
MAFIFAMLFVGICFVAFVGAAKIIEFFFGEEKANSNEFVNLLRFISIIVLAWFLLGWGFDILENAGVVF